MLTPQGLKEMADSILELVSYCRITIDGDEVILNPSGTRVNNNRIDILFMVSEQVAGEMTRFELVSKTETILATKPLDIKKLPGNGLMIRFSFSITEG